MATRRVVKRYATGGTIPALGRRVAPVTTVGTYGVAPPAAASGSPYERALSDLQSSYQEQLSRVERDYGLPTEGNRLGSPLYQSLKNEGLQQMVDSGLVGGSVGLAPANLAFNTVSRAGMDARAQLLSQLQQQRSGVYMQQAQEALANKQLAAQSKLAKQQLDLQRNQMANQQFLEMSRLSAYRNQLSQYQPRRARNTFQVTRGPSAYGPLPGSYASLQARYYS